MNNWWRTTLNPMLQHWAVVVDSFRRIPSQTRHSHWVSLPGGIQPQTETDDTVVSYPASHIFLLHSRCDFCRPRGFWEETARTTSRLHGGELGNSCDRQSVAQASKSWFEVHGYHSDVQTTFLWLIPSHSHTLVHGWPTPKLIQVLLPFPMMVGRKHIFWWFIVVKEHVNPYWLFWIRRT